MHAPYYEKFEINFEIVEVSIVLFIRKGNIVEIKEGCNWGHGLSAAIKIGTPEKTVGASQLHSGVY